MTHSQPLWLPALATYLAAIGALNLVWEVLQLPLFTIWATGSLAERTFAVVHCTGGDLLIALVSLVIALIGTWATDWPRQGFRRVAVLAIVLGIAYTAFSEWLNVYVRQSWAYADWMHTVAVGTIRIGVSPLLQWLVVPTLAFLAVKSVVRNRMRAEPGR
ncbi:MAG: hypothetical protein AB7O44_29755, partial [Hyphomicrobiaceae bacterium]